MTEREFAVDVVKRLAAHGHRALFAGGCVRDELLGLTPADYDIATDARPEQVQGLFRRTVAVGASFGVVEVLGPRGGDGEWLKVQVATFRSDGAYTDGRRPDAVTFSSPEQDAERRDFTVNGLFLDPLTGEVIDYVGGRADLAAKVLRAIGDPAARFAEDKLRVLRAVRMAARFDLAVDPGTLAAGLAFAPEVRVVSAERIADELRKILASPTRGRGVRLLREFGLVPVVLPEVALDERWDLLLTVVDALPADAGFPLAFAAVLREYVKSEHAVGVAERLRLSNAEGERVAWLVAHQAALIDARAMKFSRLQPFLIHPGVGDLLALHGAVAMATGQEAWHVARCEAMLRAWSPAELDPPPLVTGNDLRAWGLKPGPLFKRILSHIRDLQLDGEVADRNAAEAVVRQMIA